MAFPDHLLALATLRLLTLAPNERFHSIKASPLRVLTELTSAYLHLLAGAAKGSAEQAGRTSANALDARQAIAQYGLSLDELFEWCEERRLDGGILAQNGKLEDGEGEVSSLGALLKDTTYDSSHQNPRQVIEYAPLNRREDQIYQTVQSNQSLLPFLPYTIQQQVQAGNTEDDSSDSDIEMDPRNTHSPSPSSSRALSLPPTYQQAIASGSSSALTFKQREKQRAQKCRDEVDYMSFLPPFPDRDATQAALQTVVEDESGRTIKRARRAIEPSSKRSGATAWMRAIPYDASSLAEFEGPNLTLPSIPPDTVAASFDYEDDLLNGQDAESTAEGLSKQDDPLTSSSLFYFLETFNWVSLEYEQQGEQAMLPLRHNLKRKRAATAIHSNILNPSDDSLSGNIPVAQPRHAKKQAGWIPYPPVSKDLQDASEPAGKAVLPFPAMHPFSTQLPPTITEPVPTVMLPHATRVLAPAMHPRYPTAHSSVRTLLEAQSLALFTRTTRLGPPGPLLDNGSAGFYQIEAEKPNIPGWPGDAAPRMLGWNFDWEIGNELEDAIKERKTAGIINVAEVQSDAPVASTSTVLAKTQNFPALPARPADNRASMLRRPSSERIMAPIAEPAAPMAELTPVLEPIAPIAEPAAPITAPAASIPEPIASIPEPIAPTGELTAPIPEPIAPISEPTAPIPEAAAPIPEATAPTPEPTQRRESMTTPERAAALASTCGRRSPDSGLQSGSPMTMLADGYAARCVDEPASRHLENRLTLRLQLRFGRTDLKLVAPSLNAERFNGFFSPMPGRPSF